MPKAAACTDPEYLPTTVPSGTGSRKAATTRSVTRERNSALLLASPSTPSRNSSPPLTSPRNTYRYGKRRNRKVSNTLEIPDTASTMTTGASTIVPANDVTSHHAALRKHPSIPSLSLQGSSIGGSKIDTLASALDSSTQNTVHPCSPKATTVHDLPTVEPNISPPTHSGIASDVDLTTGLPSFMDHLNAIEATIEGLKDEVAKRDRQILEKEALLIRVCPIMNDILFVY